MKIEEAIKCLKIRKSLVADINLQALQAFGMAIDALEKQIPRSVKIEISDIPYEADMILCPACEETLTYMEYPYCYECGQAIKWEESE